MSGFASSTHGSLAPNASTGIFPWFPRTEVSPATSQCLPPRVTLPNSFRAYLNLPMCIIVIHCFQWWSVPFFDLRRHLPSLDPVRRTMGHLVLSGFDGPHTARILYTERRLFVNVFRRSSVRLWTGAHCYASRSLWRKGKNACNGEQGTVWRHFLVIEPAFLNIFFGSHEISLGSLGRRCNWIKVREQAQFWHFLQVKEHKL